MKRTLLASVALAALVMACDKKSDNKNNTMYPISASMNGSQEVPAVTTSGTGTVGGTYDASTNTLHYSVSWSGLTGAATMAHFHGPALAGANASVVVPFTVSGASAVGTATSPMRRRSTCWPASGMPMCTQEQILQAKSAARWPFRNKELRGNVLINSWWIFRS